MTHNSRHNLISKTPEHFYSYYLTNMYLRYQIFNIFWNVEAIYPPNTPEIFLPSLYRFYVSEHALMGKWKAYLKWEESNPSPIPPKSGSSCNICNGVAVHPIDYVIVISSSPGF